MTFKRGHGNMSGMKSAASVYNASPVYTFYKTLSLSSMRPTALRCIASIFYNFFFRQFRAAWLPGRAPVSRVDHPLDKKIPFLPAWVTIYLDFVLFWIRMLSFLLQSFGRRSFGPVMGFVQSMGELYAFASEAYRKNFSTTDRPFYIARPRFFLIHLLDPHLMCVPSLHVMVVIHTYTRFAAILRSMGVAERYASQIEELKQGALAITQASLFVKQHSVNCIPAALYAMTRYDPELFPPETAEAYTDLLFSAPPPSPQSGLPGNYRVRPWAAPRTKLPAADIAEFKAHIVNLYRRFLAGGKDAKSWEEPLLEFIKPLPKR
jgi:hypothetical protein